MRCSAQRGVRSVYACGVGSVVYVLGEPARLGQRFWQRALPALSTQRREKVLAYRFDRDRTLSAAAYLLLRLALTEACGITAMPEFALSPRGKPQLKDGGPQFSLSHCHRAVACALHVEAPHSPLPPPPSRSTVSVGVDVECWDAFAPEHMDKKLLQHLFSRAEQTRILSAPNPAQAACALWTARESVGKYTGLGLEDGLPLVPSDVYVHTLQLELYRVSLSLCVHEVTAKDTIRLRKVTPHILQDYAASFAQTF